MADLNKLLIIEDNEEVVEAISIALQIRWPDIRILSTGSGEQGIDLIMNKKPDIIILDLGLIDINGFEVLKRVRMFSNIPVVILTVRGEEADIIKGFELGADDFITKPFKQLELIARITAIARRVNLIGGEDPIVCGNFYFDHSMRTVKYNGKQTTLTHTENSILLKLIQNKNIVVTYDKIAEEIWGINYPDAADSIKVYVRRLREKIEPDPSRPRFLLNKSGLGYLFTTRN
ncbi:MAG: response regulator transcription factor [Dehalococcoidia bacterium]|nr:MAG: response regulator transcription factor [Dehalococcoidia bacterium]